MWSRCPGKSTFWKTLSAIQDFDPATYEKIMRAIRGDK